MFRPLFASGAVLAALIFVFGPSEASAQCVAPPDNMVHWWTGDDNTFDIVGGSHGVLRGDATYGDGMVIRAFSFDGDGDYVEVPHDDAAAFNFTGSFTVDAWVNLESTPPDFAPILSKWNDIGVDQRNYFIAIENHFGNLVVRFDVSGNGLFIGGGQSSRSRTLDVIPLNTWTHIAGVFDGSAHTLRVYINGPP